MPKIVITEIDETTPGVNAESNEVVYVPGCVDDTLSSLWALNKETGVNEYIGLPLNQPTLFTSVQQFETLCGKSGLKFTQDWDYRKLTCIKGKDGVKEQVVAFAADAIPYHSKMFTAGTVDPGYVMAKELLAAGMNVMYERINPNTGYEEIKKEDILDFDNAFANYFAKVSYLAPISDAKVPTDDTKRNFYKYAESGTALDNVLVPSSLIEETTKSNDVKVNDAYVSTEHYYVKDETAPNKERVLKKDELELTKDEKFAEVTIEGNTIYTKEPIVKLKVTGDAIELSSAKIYGSTVIKGVKYTLLPRVAVSEVTPSSEFAPNSETGVRANDYTDSIYCELIEDNAEEENDEVYVAVPHKDYTDTIYTKSSGVQLDKVYESLLSIYDFDPDRPEGLSDKGNYNVKYITSGGYPVYEYDSGVIVSKMLAFAANRGDCYALIDHTDNLGRESNITKDGSLFKSLDEEITNGEYGAMFTPWALYTRVTTDKKEDNTVDKTVPSTVRMPASYAYLQSLAYSLKTNAPWLAVAGAARGSVRYLADGGMTTVISNGVADAMQPRQGISINAITNIKPYGQTIWGNRTLKWNKEDLVATSFLNIRNLVCDVKKIAYSTARALTFEQDNEVLWINFKSRIAPTLDRMLSGYGISGYKIVRNTEHEKAREKATVCARIILYPTYAVEDFYIDIVLRDGEATIESNA